MPGRRTGPGPIGQTRPGQHMFAGWKHLQHALGFSLHRSVGRSRKLARARLRGKR